jgi:transposase
MATTRLHGGRAAERQVMKLYYEGWHIPNIASMAQIGAHAVIDILSKNNILIKDILK